jgi:hypothetical protein
MIYVAQLLSSRALAEEQSPRLQAWSVPASSPNEANLDATLLSSDPEEACSQIVARFFHNIPRSGPDNLMDRARGSNIEQ